MEHSVTLQFQNYRAKITGYEPGIIRIQRSFTGAFRENSPILMDATTLKPECTGKSVFSAFGMDLAFDETGAMDWTDGSAHFREVPGRHLIRRGQQTIHSFCLEDCLYYGFGEKTGPLEKTGFRMRFSGKDAIGYDPQHTDPLYKHVPFFLKMASDGKSVCGVFYHTAADCEIDMGREVNGYYPPMGQFITEEKEVDLFLIRGKDMAEVLKNFTLLTGRPLFPPKYALGYLGSTMFYTELPKDCDKEILGFVEKAKRLGIPCSNFQLSSGYTTDSKGLRNVFSWNREKSPSPETFAGNMEKAGAPITPNVKPALLTSNPLYEAFRDAGAFIHQEDGSPVVARFWGGQGSFVDFTNPRARALWKQCLKENLLNYGIRSIWNDNNEFDINEGYCDNDGAPLPAIEVRAILPLLMNQAAWEALEECYPGQRPYMVSRSGSAGINRYAQVWTGDNRTGWDSLQWNIATMLGSSLSGMSVTGSDVGGFAGGAPEMELFLRWIACGVVMPRFSIHSANNDNTVTEPWMYLSQMDTVRKLFSLRNRLMPLLYSLHYEAHTEGLPIWRPMVWQYPEDRRCQKENVDFFLGNGLLCACTVEKGAKSRKVYLPEGVFYDFYTRQRYAGNQEVTLDAPLDKLILLQKGGSIVPTQEIDGLHLWICPEESCDFLYYDDDGQTRDIHRPEVQKLHIRLTREEDFAVVDLQLRSGTMPQIRKIAIQCHEKAPAGVWDQGTSLPQVLDVDAFECCEKGWHYDPEHKLCLVHSNHWERIRVSFGTRDLIMIDGKKE